jgi:hypothetical protein
VFSMSRLIMRTAGKTSRETRALPVNGTTGCSDPTFAYIVFKGFPAADRYAIPTGSGKDTNPAEKAHRQTGKGSDVGEWCWC